MGLSESKEYFPRVNAELVELIELGWNEFELIQSVVRALRMELSILKAASRQVETGSKY